MVQARGENQSGKLTDNGINTNYHASDNHTKSPALVPQSEQPQNSWNDIDDDHTNSLQSIQRTNTSANTDKRTGTSLPAVNPNSTMMSTVPPENEPEHPTSNPTTNKTSLPIPQMPELREDAQTSTPSNSSRAEFTTVFDIIDKMEKILDSAKPSVFAPSVVKIDREEFMDVLTDLKKMLPVQLERASALMRESERRLEKAQIQAKAIVTESQSQAAEVLREANQQAEFLASQENVVAIAQNKAQSIIERTQAQSNKLIQGANQYATKVMEALNTQLMQYQQDVQAGIEVLKERERGAASQLDQSYVEDN